MNQTTTLMALELASLCGCAFRIEKRTDNRMRLHLRSGATEIIRTYNEVHPSHIDPFFEFAYSVGLAIESDQEAGLVRDNFVDPELTSKVLGLELRFDVVNDHNDHVRAELVLQPREDLDSLDYCHIGATVDVSLRHLREATETAMRAHPLYGW